jgi:redox-sensitive bicupin YhaK (pirin superfamily)
MSHRRVVGTLVGIALVAAIAGAIQRENVTRRIPQFENQEVKVWKSIIMPNQPLSMHRHESPRAIIALAGGTLKIVKESGESRAVIWETGKAYWLDADPPGELHGDVNESAHPIEVMVVEVKNASRPSP